MTQCGVRSADTACVGSAFIAMRSARCPDLYRTYFPVDAEPRGRDQGRSQQRVTRARRALTPMVFPVAEEPAF